MNDLIEKCVVSFLKLIKLELSDVSIGGLVQFIKFGIVGLSNTVISYLLNILVLMLMMPMNVSWDFIAGNIVAFVLSVLWSFYWNNKFVFTVQEGEQRSIFKALIKTYISYGFTGIILNNVLSWIWIDIFHISKFIAPLINLIVSVPLNFIINKLWAFKSDK